MSEILLDYLRQREIAAANVQEAIRGLRLAETALERANNTLARIDSQLNFQLPDDGGGYLHKGSLYRKHDGKRGNTIDIIPISK